MDHCADSLPRLRLAEMAAAGVDVRPQLRLLMLAEGLAAQPTRRALDLNAETAALCAAVNESVRRRAGWLYFVPAPSPLPTTLPRSLCRRGGARLASAFSQVGRADGGVAEQLLSRALQGDAARLQHVAPVGNLQRGVGVLLN